MVQRHDLRALTRRRADERGLALILGALSLSVVFTMAALAVDLGMVREENGRASAAADAASLAGALQLEGGTGNTCSAGTTAASAVACAKAYATADGYAGAVVNIPPVSGPHAGIKTCVEVITTQQQAGVFSRVIGVNTFSVTGRAVACQKTGGLGTFNIIALDASAPQSFLNQANSGTTLNLGAGGVFVNSAAGTAYSNTGHNPLSIDQQAQIAVVGGQSGGCQFLGSSPPPCTPNTGVTAPNPVDPLAATTVAPPVPTSSSPTPCSQTSGTFQPGIYNCTLTIKGSATFTSGNYKITGGLVITANGGTITYGDSNATTYLTLGGVGYEDKTNGGVTFTSTQSTGVMFYLSPTVSSSPAWETTSNGDTYTLYPPASGTDKGVSIYVDPTVPAADQSIQFDGNAQGLGVTGAVYGPKAQVLFNANGGSYAISSIVADTIAFASNTTVTATGSGYTEGGPTGVTLVE